MLRLVMRLGEALALLAAVTRHPKHSFWPELLPFEQVRWHGVMGHRQVTNAHPAGLARSNNGKLASFDTGPVALHPDVGVSVGT